MLDFQGIPIFPAVEPTAEKRQAAPGTEKPSPLPAASFPSAFSRPTQDYSTFQFKAGNPVPPSSPALAKPALPPLFLNVAVGGNLERIAAQVAGFFFGNRKEKPTDEERERRRLQDAFGRSFAEGLKVEGASQGSLGQGAD